MWSRGGRNQIIWQIIQRSRNNILSLSAVQKGSSWLSLSILGSEREEVKKTTSSLSIRSAMIRTSLKMILIIVTFTFLSSACSCSTANLIKDPGEWKTNIIWVLLCVSKAGNGLVSLHCSLFWFFNSYWRLVTLTSMSIKLHQLKKWSEKWQWGTSYLICFTF